MMRLCLCQRGDMCSAVCIGRTKGLARRCELAADAEHKTNNRNYECEANTDILRACLPAKILERLLKLLYLYSIGWPCRTASQLLARPQLNEYPHKCSCHSTPDTLCAARPKHWAHRELDWHRRNPS